MSIAIVYIKLALILCVSAQLDGKIDKPCDDDFPWDNARLPQTIFPVHYDLVVHPNLSDFLFRGSVNIVLDVTKNSKFIVINAADLSVENVRLQSTNGTKIPISTQLCSAREQLIAISETGGSLDLRAGTSFNLSMTFRGDMIDKLKGLYRSSYMAENGTRKYMAVTQFSPTDARRMFPCFDEPLFKATFQTSIIRIPSMIALSNMPLLNTVQQPDNLLMDNFQTTLKMSTYLIAVVVFDFPKQSKTTKNGVEVSVYAPQIQLNQTSYALNVVIDALEFHESFLKIPFPLKKLDVVAVGDFAFNAMENWGLMTFRDTTILYDPEKSSVKDEDNLVTVVSHETGHQWFGNLVTMKWWAELWLKEGFARFLETFAASKIRPDWGLMELIGPNVMREAFSLDGLNSTHPLSVPVAETSEIRAVFDAIAYNKGAAIIFMLLNILGEENLQAGLNDYLKTYQYSNVDGWQFWQILSKHASGLQDMKLDEIADTWTLQPGHPYVTVVNNGSSLILHQKRFFYSNKCAVDYNNSASWTIPFTFVTDSGENQLVWFNSSNFIIPLKRPTQRWFKANTNGTGFYRVLYAPEVWRTFGQMLKQNLRTFSSTDRSNLISDAFGFVRAGLLNITYALELVEYLSSEVEAGPLSSAMAALGHVDIIHMGSSLHQPFRNYMRGISGPLYKNASWILPKDHKQRRFFSNVLSASCGYGTKDCRAQATAQFESWLRNGTKINPDLLDTVLASAIETNPEKYWDVFWKEYVETNVPAEKTKFLTAMCATPKQDQLRWLLNASLDDTKIRGNLLPQLVRNIAANPNDGLRLVWNFTKENWDRIYKIGGGNAVLGNYVSFLGSFSQKADLDEVLDFFSRRDVNGAKRSLDQAVESIQINIQWRDLNDNDLEAYIKRFSSDSVALIM